MTKFIFQLMCTIFLSTSSCTNAKYAKTDLNNSASDYFITEYGTDLTEAGLYAIQTSDSGFILTGLTTAYTLGAQGLRVIKIDKFGNIEWQSTYGTESSETGCSIIETTNHEYVICGHSALYGETDHDILFLRISNSGELLWSKMIGGSDYDYGTDILELPDGSLILEGYSYSYGSGKDDLFLAKFTPEGDSLWTKIYGGEFNEHGYAVDHTSDNGFIITGFTKSFNNSFYKNWPTDSPINPDECYYDLYIIKTDSLGDIIWTRTMGKEGHDRGQSVRETKDSCFIVVGHTTSFSSGSDILLVKIACDGTLLWSKTYTTEYTDAAYSIELVADGGFIISGETGYSENDTLQTAGLLIKTDENGEPQWSKIIPLAGGNTVLYQSNITLDSGYFAVGKTIRTKGSAFGLIFLKLDANGDCNSSLPSCKITVNNVALDVHTTTTIVGSGLNYRLHKLEESDVVCARNFID